jgi:hypothetical protein
MGTKRCKGLAFRNENNRGPLKIHFLLRVAARVTSFVAFYHHISPDMASKSASLDTSFAYAHLKTEYLEVP